MENEKKTPAVAIIIAIIGALALIAVPIVSRLMDYYFPPPTPATNSTRVITVPATLGWYKTGLLLQSGRSILITATGRVDYDGSNEAIGKANPDGDDIPCDKEAVEARLNQELYIECLISGVPYGALVGRVGESIPFLIGSSRQFTTNISGELYLGVNDCCSLTDNSGEFNVTILSH